MHILIVAIAWAIVGGIVGYLSVHLPWRAFLCLRWLFLAPQNAAVIAWHDLHQKPESSFLKSLAAAVAICTAVALVLLPLFPH